MVNLVGPLSLWEPAVVNNRGYKHLGSPTRTPEMTDRKPGRAREGQRVRKRARERESKIENVRERAREREGERKRESG